MIYVFEDYELDTQRYEPAAGVCCARLNPRGSMCWSTSCSIAIVWSPRKNCSHS